MSNITKNHKVGIFAVFIASALMLGTISVTGFDSASALTGSHDISKFIKGNGDGNRADQELEQKQFNKQDSQCITGVLSLVDCNNVALQLDANLGNNALGQK
jgi:hypothetical protein